MCGLPSFFFKQKTAYEMRISDWSSDVCSSDLADRASVAQELGGDPARAMAAPKHSLQRKLVNGLRYLLKEELKLNQPEASDGWLTGDALWLVSKTVSDKLRAHLLSQGVDGITANNRSEEHTSELQHLMRN